MKVKYGCYVIKKDKKYLIEKEYDMKDIQVIKKYQEIGHRRYSTESRDIYYKILFKNEDKIEISITLAYWFFLENLIYKLNNYGTCFLNPDEIRMDMYFSSDFLEEQIGNGLDWACAGVSSTMENKSFSKEVKKDGEVDYVIRLIDNHLMFHKIKGYFKSYFKMTFSDSELAELILKLEEHKRKWIDE